MTQYRLIAKDHVSEEKNGAETVLRIKPEALALLAKEAVKDVSFYLRAGHLEQLAEILKDAEASDNDRFVAATLLKNAVIAAKGVLPTCQDTGTLTVFAEKGENVRTGACDAEALSKGVFDAFRENALRYSQVAPFSIFQEANTGTNLPAQIEIHSTSGNEYRFLFIAKGGGSANKTVFFQQTPAVLNEKALSGFLREKLPELGTAGCPPYHIAVVIGGLSPEMNLKTVKLAAAGYYDGLPADGNELGRAFRDLGWEARVLKLARETGIGAQFGGKYFAHDARVIRLPRHAASCPIGIGISCSADRNIKAKITPAGIFLEQLEKCPERFFGGHKAEPEPGISIDLDRPIAEVLKELSRYPVKTRLNLSGTLIVARDLAHARIKERLEAGKPLPGYIKQHPVFYAGPAKTPEGKVVGSLGPTTSSRMDDYAGGLMAHGASLVMLGKGNRSSVVRDACKRYGGFYLGTVGGPAAVFAEENILSVETLDFEGLGMEAVRKVRVKNLPAFIVFDDKGNDFFEGLQPEV